MAQQIDRPKPTLPTPRFRVVDLISIEPTERLVWALVGVAVLGTLSAGLPLLEDGLWLYLAALVLMAGADLALAGNPRAVRIERAAPPLWVQGAATEFTRVFWARRAMNLEVTDALPLCASPDGRGDEHSLQFHIRANERARIGAQATLYRRGKHRFRRCTVRTLGPLGLFRRRARHSVDTEVQATPDLQRIVGRATRLLRGQDADGARRRRSSREGRELESLREYQRGDDPRLIEWKVSARVGEFVVRKMQPETRQDVVVVVDTGRQLAGYFEKIDGGGPRIDVSVDVALTLCAAVLMNHDRAGCMAYAGTPRAHVPSGADAGHLRRIFEQLRDLEVRPEEPDYGALMRQLLATQKRRSLVVFITDVIDEPSARALAGAVAQLRGRHLPMVVSVLDPALTRLARPPAVPAGMAAHSGNDPQTPPAALQALAAQRLLAHRQSALAALATAGALTIDAPLPRAAALAVRGYLHAKSTGRL